VSGELARRLTGIGNPGVPERDDVVWAHESMGWLAVMATARTYADQPGLWHLGEEGRARTIEDFGHHLRAALAGDLPWREHVRYSLQLFDARGFPQRWLREAFATLSAVLLETFGDSFAREVRDRLGDGPALLEQLAAEAGIDLDRPTRYDAPAATADQ
jgi:hypothetical protein